MLLILSLSSFSIKCRIKNSKDERETYVAKMMISTQKRINYVLLANSCHKVYTLYSVIVINSSLNELDNQSINFRILNIIINIAYYHELCILNDVTIKLLSDYLVVYDLVFVS